MGVVCVRVFVCVCVCLWNSEEKKNRLCFVFFFLKGSGPNYWPNSVDGTPQPVGDKASESKVALSGTVARHIQDHANNDFEQVKNDGKKEFDEKHLKIFIHTHTHTVCKYYFI